MRTIILSLALALFWAVLHGEYSLRSLVIGCAVGWAVLTLLYRSQRSAMPYVVRPSARKAWRSAAYSLRLLWEILLAGLTVTRLVLDWRKSIRPGIIVVPADVKGDVEVTLLANSITLTPGTWTLDIPRDRSVLYVHALDLQDPEQTKADIKQRLEKFILRASRC
ncbi:MAG: Na+/H+ antiporter subunit E [Chloroflexi bacterium]|nr:Na+/H+ antiporter subunit E [Chloroflexota bacterium]